MKRITLAALFLLGLLPAPARAQHSMYLEKMKKKM